MPDPSDMTLRPDPRLAVEETIRKQQLEAEERRLAALNKERQAAIDAQKPALARDLLKAGIQPPVFARNMPSDAELENRYTYHPPFGDQAQRYAAIRAKILETAKFIRDRTPCCPEQSKAFNALDDAMFLANASIARHEKPPG